MPNGALIELYGHSILQAGKLKDEIRYRFTASPDFKALENSSKRIKVIYFKNDMPKKFSSKLSFYKDIYNSQ